MFSAGLYSAIAIILIHAVTTKNSDFLEHPMIYLSGSLYALFFIYALRNYDTMRSLLRNVVFFITATVIYLATVFVSIMLAATMVDLESRRHIVTEALRFSIPFVLVGALGAFLLLFTVSSIYKITITKKQYLRTSLACAIAVLPFSMLFVLLPHDLAFLPSTFIPFFVVSLMVGSWQIVFSYRLGNIIKHPKLQKSDKTES